MQCATCGRKGLDAPGPRRDTCPSCGSDLRSCVHCKFYAVGHYNNCREPQAERVADPTRANFCDYFKPSEGDTRGASDAVKDRVKADLEALFHKKP